MSDATWIHPGPISPLDCDQAGCGWRVHGVPDKYHANALARHTAEAHQPVGDVNAGDEKAMQALSEEGAMCGEYCGDEPGGRRCADCERCRRGYVEALRKAGWAPRAEVIAERDAQIIAWLAKKAGEYGVSNRDARAKAEAVGRMADKLSRGAVR